jgi:peptidoglycan/LPS O-acetylase OafA/YrhL
LTESTFSGAGGTSSAPGERRERFDALDSLRGVAACWVVVFHLPNGGHSWPLPIVQNGFLAVTFFFVLSGFVIASSYGKRLAQGYPLSKYMLLRWGRIYPLHAFMIGVLLLYEIARLIFGFGAWRSGAPFTGWTDPMGLLWNLALLQNATPELSWNRPSWSIGVEFWTYLIAALVVRGLRREQMLAAGLLMFVPTFVFGYAQRKLGFGMPSELSAILNCVSAFGFGIVAFGVRQLGWFRSWMTFDKRLATLAELVAILLVIGTSWAFASKLSLLNLPSFVLMVWVFSFEAGWFSQLFKTRPMALLGLLSYSIYMVHQFIQERLLELIAAASGQGLVPLTVPETGRLVIVGNPWLCDLVTVIMLLLVIGTSWLTYHFVEDPARRWSRRLSGSMGKPAPGEVRLGHS